MDTEENDGAQSQRVEEKEAWIQLWQFQENLC